MLIDVNNSSLIDIYVGDDGKLHKVKGGADTVLPFNKSSGLVRIKTTIGVNSEIDVSGYNKITFANGSNYGHNLLLYGKKYGGDYVQLEYAIAMYTPYDISEYDIIMLQPHSSGGSYNDFYYLLEG